MVIGREKILELVKRKKLIEDFSEDCLGGAGYDLRVGGIYRLKGGGFLGTFKRETPDVEEIRFDEKALRGMSEGKPVIWISKGGFSVI